MNIIENAISLFVVVVFTIIIVNFFIEFEQKWIRRVLRLDEITDLLQDIKIQLHRMNPPRQMPTQEQADRPRSAAAAHPPAKE